MKYLFLLLCLFTSLLSSGQEITKLPKSISLVPKEDANENSLNKYFMSIHFEYDNQNRLTTWTDSTYNKNAGGIVVKKEVITYDGNNICSITSYKNGEETFKSNIIYKNSTIEIHTSTKFHENRKYETPTIIELNDNGDPFVFTGNIYNKSNTTTIEYDDKGNISTISSDKYKKSYEYGNKKGIYHDINMPSWFWILTDKNLLGIQFYSYNILSVATTTYSLYSETRTGTRKVTTSFDKDGYPILLKGIITNGFTLKVNYQE